MSGCVDCKCEEHSEKEIVDLKDKLDTMEGEYIHLLNELYQLEDPRGGCVIQRLRLLGEAVVGHDCRNQPKRTHIREEFFRTIVSSWLDF